MITKASRRKNKMEEMHKFIEEQIQYTDDVEDLTCLAVIFLTSAKQILITNHGKTKTKEVIKSLSDGIVSPQTLMKINEA